MLTSECTQAAPQTAAIGLHPGQQQGPDAPRADVRHEQKASADSHRRVCRRKAHYPAARRPAQSHEQGKALRPMPPQCPGRSAHEAQSATSASGVVPAVDGEHRRAEQLPAGPGCPTCVAWRKQYVSRPRHRRLRRRATGRRQMLRVSSVTRVQLLMRSTTSSCVSSVRPCSSTYSTSSEFVLISLHVEELQNGRTATDGRAADVTPVHAAYLQPPRRICRERHRTVVFYPSATTL